MLLAWALEPGKYAVSLCLAPTHEEPARRLGQERIRNEVDQREQERHAHRNAPPQVCVVRKAQVYGTVEGETKENADVDTDVRDGHEPAAPLLWRHLGNVHCTRAPCAT
eukprot:scaffold322461_cov39-Tisochrysis_lutea.AAC.2